MNMQTPLVLGALTLASWSALAADSGLDLPVRFALRSDWTMNHYGKDAFRCWNDGVAATCGQTKNQLESETEGRVNSEIELNDTWELRMQAQLGAYYNVGWYEKSQRSTSSINPNNGEKPRWVTQLQDTWVGLNHEDLGLVRIGSGLNPYQQASGQMDGNTDLGGKELLDRMVAYDSPLLLGDKATGLSLKAAVYDGNRYRKVKLLQSEEDKASGVRAKGFSLLLDGKLNGNISGKLAVFSEKYGARAYYGTGPLDGSYTTVTGTDYGDPAATTYAGQGSKVKASGIAADVSYESDSFRVGIMAMHNARAKASLRNTAMASAGMGTGYTSDGMGVYFSTWSGPWSLWSKVSQVRFELADGDGLNSSSDWLYANSTFTATKASGEISYEWNKYLRLVGGSEWMKRDFKESPLADGKCATGKANACYDPEGLKVYLGVRTNF